MESGNVAARGSWGTVEWAVDARGNMPGKEFYMGLSADNKAKVVTLFQRLAETGRITNRQHFRQLGPTAGPNRGLFEFKRFQIRFIGDFRPGNRFIVAHGLIKKADKLPKADIEKAARILAEHDARERRLQ